MNEIGHHICLYSGIGGFSIAAEACGFRTIVFCESDPKRQRDLKHHWPNVPCIADVNDVEAICRVVADGRREPPQSNVGRIRSIAGNGRRATLLTGGPPCQPASSAGQRKGSADDRWLWPQTLRVVAKLRPDFCVFENPLGIASLAQSAAILGVDIERLRSVPGRTLTEILSGLAALGYELPCDRDGIPWIPVVPAAGVGAFHGRDRLWIIARRRDVADPELPKGAQCGQLHQRGIRDAESENDSQASEGSRGVVGDSADAQSNSAGSGNAGTRRPPFGPRGGRELPNWSDAQLERGQDGIWRATQSGLRLLVDGMGYPAEWLNYEDSATPSVRPPPIKSSRPLRRKSGTKTNFAAETT